MKLTRVFATIGAIALPAVSTFAQALFVPDGATGIGISSTANIGVGTSAPQAALHVVATADSSSILWSEIVENPANANLVGYGVGLRLQNSKAAGSGNEMHKWAGLAAVAGSTYSNRTDLVFYTSNFDSSANLTSAPSERMRILANTGDLGIGTSAPSAKLDVITTRTNDGVAIGNGVNTVKFMPGTVGTSAYNPLTVAGDNMIMFSNGAVGTGTLVIAPWASTAGGIRMDASGNVGIGTKNLGGIYKLSVNGTVRAKEVIVDTGWSDYVFAPDYRLAPLSEVERHIKAEQHLPGIPSAAEVAERGISVGEMQAKLLAKIEELTLHVIEQEKRTQAQAAGMAALLAENAELRARVDALSQGR